MGRKRKQSGGKAGGGDRPVMTRQKRRAIETEAAKPVGPNSDIDAPEVAEVIKVELESESDLEVDNNQQELFGEDSDSGNQHFASNADIDIGEVNLMQTPKTEDKGVDEEDSNKLNDNKTPSMNPDIERNVDGAPSTSTSLKGRAGPRECENGNGPTDGDENNETNSNFSSNSNGNPLLNKMAEKCETSSRVKVEVFDEDTASTAIDGQLLSGGTTAAEEAQETRSGSVKKDVSKSPTGVSEKDVKYMQSMQKKDENIITRLTAELKAARDRNEMLQRKVETLRTESKNEIQNYAARFKGLKAELEETRGEMEILKRELFAKNVDLERQTSQAAQLREEQRKLVQETSRTVEMLQERLNRKTDGLNNSILEKDNELALLQARYSRDLQGNSQPHQANGVKFNLVCNNGNFTGSSNGNTTMNRLGESSVNGRPKPKTLAVAIKDEDEDSVKVPIRSGANVNETTNNNGFFEAPLYLAAKSKNKTFAINTAKLLINSEANFDTKHSKGNGIFLHELVDFSINPEQLHEVAAFLISKNLTRLFNTPDDARVTPFHQAVQFVEIETATLSLLKDNGVDFNEDMALKEPFLTMATSHIWSNKVKIIAMLTCIKTSKGHSVGG